MNHGTTSHDRRTFIKHTSGLAATALLAPVITRPHRANANPLNGLSNDRLVVAAIGVGRRGAIIGHEAGTLGNMVACADVDARNANNFARVYDGRCKIYEDYRRILDRKDIDVIVCGTPDHWHTKIVIETLQAGKDIYCEKPLTLTIDESRQISEAMKDSGRVLQVGTHQRTEYDRRFLKAVAITRSGRLGNELHATCSIGQADVGGPFPIAQPPKELNFDFWLGQAPLVEFTPNRVGRNFRWWLEYSGGRITDWGAHHIDISLWSLGGDQRGVISVQGTGVFPGLPDGINVLDFLHGHVKLPNSYNVARDFECVLTLANGSTITLNSKPPEIILAGEKGRIRVSRARLTGKPIEEIAESETELQWLEDEVAKLYRQMPIDTHMTNFFHCVRTREVPISDVYTHCNAVNACHMANIAMLVKRKIHFDLDKYKFVNDDEANLFRSRPQRYPYRIQFD